MVRSGTRKWRDIVGTLCASMASLLVLPLMASARNDVSKIITIIVPYAAGGLGDILPRATADLLGQQTGHTFIIDNKPGATQMIGARAAVNAKPDGSTILFGSVTSLAINPGVKKSMPYDPVKDFEPISLTFVSPMYLVTRRDLPVNSVADLIALAKREPDKLTYASGGLGSSSHLAAELFKTIAGISIIHVPYQSTGPAVRDVIGGHVDLMFTGSGMSYANSNQVKALAVTSAKRAEAAPEVPSLAELGLTEYEATIWFGFLAPAGTPKDIVDWLSAEIKKSVDTGALRQKLKASGDEIDLVGSTPAEFGEFIAKEIPRWREVIRAANVQPE